jgi:hypothetical protein
MSVSGATSSQEVSIRNTNRRNIKIVNKGKYNLTLAARAALQSPMTKLRIKPLWVQTVAQRKAASLSFRGVNDGLSFA